MLRHCSDCPVAWCCDCSSAPAQADLSGGRRCSSCLSTQVLGKFLKALKMNRAVNNGDRVLVAVSGGPCSMALAHLLTKVSATNEQRLERGKIRCEVHLAHINMAPAFDGPAAHALEEHTACVVTALRSFQPASVSDLRVEDVVCGHASSRAQQLRRFFGQIKDATRLEDVQRWLQVHLLKHTANQLRCNKVLLGDCADTLAARFLSALSKGDGYQSTADIQLIDARERPCVVRPLRKIARKELALYTYFQGLPFWAAHMHGVGAASRGSVNHLCSAFVSGLAVTHACALNAILTSAFKLPAFPPNDGAFAGHDRRAANGATTRNPATVPPHEAVPNAGHVAKVPSDAGRCVDSTDCNNVSALCRFCRSPRRRGELHESECERDHSAGINATERSACTVNGSASESGAVVYVLCRSCRQLLLQGKAGPDEARLLDVLPKLIRVASDAEREETFSEEQRLQDVCLVEQRLNDVHFREPRSNSACLKEQGVREACAKEQGVLVAAACKTGACVCPDDCLSKPAVRKHAA
jgi:hypothetical protein